MEERIHSPTILTSVVQASPQVDLPSRTRPSAIPLDHHSPHTFANNTHTDTDDDPTVSTPSLPRLVVFSSSETSPALHSSSSSSSGVKAFAVRRHRLQSPEHVQIARHCIHTGRGYGTRARWARDPRSRSGGRRSGVHGGDGQQARGGPCSDCHRGGIRMGMEQERKEPMARFRRRRRRRCRCRMTVY